MADEPRLTKRQLKKLVKELTGAIKKDPNNLVVRLKLAGALKDLGKAGEAVEHYEHVAKEYESTGKLVQAISVYKGILELKPGDEQIGSTLSELSAKRAQEVQAKSAPRLQQVDGRWVMPAEGNEVSEEEGTDPGRVSRPSVTASPSKLRLPAPLPTESSPSRTGRRSRRSRRSSEAAVPFEPVPDEPSPPAEPPPPIAPEVEPPPPIAAGMPSEPQVPQPSLPGLFTREEVAPPPPPPPPPPKPPAKKPAPAPARKPTPAPARKPTPAPARKPTPAPARKPAPSPVKKPAPAEISDEAVTAQTLEEPSPKPDDGVIMTAGDPDTAATGGIQEDGTEEATSPGPRTYDETIRKSALGAEALGLKGGPRQKSKEGQRRTIMGMPMPSHPDLPAQEGTPAEPTPRKPAPPKPAKVAAAKPVARIKPKTVTRPSRPKTDAFDQPTAEVPADKLAARARSIEASAAAEAPAEPKPAKKESAAPPPSETKPKPAEETVATGVFDDDEEAFWQELSGRQDDDERDEKKDAKDEKDEKRDKKDEKKDLKKDAKEEKVEKKDPKKDPKRDEQRVMRKPGATLPGRANLKAKPKTDPKAVQLEDIQLFRDLTESSREMLRSRLVRHEKAKDSAVVREGDPGHALFVVISGTVRVVKNADSKSPIKLALLGPGQFFGEFALLSDRKRHATVLVEEDAVLYEISRKVIADLTKSDPDFGKTLRQFYRRRLLASLVTSAPFFKPLSQKEREALMGRLRFRRIQENTKIITEGEPGGGFFLILIGEVKVTKTEKDGSEKTLAKLNDGMYFGEMSLLKGGSAVATVTTVTPTEIVQLAAAEFYRILSNYPQIWEEVNREAKRRELANLQILSGRSPKTLADNGGVVM